MDGYQSIKIGLAGICVWVSMQLGGIDQLLTVLIALCLRGLCDWRNECNRNPDTIQQDWCKRNLPKDHNVYHGSTLRSSGSAVP